MLHITLNVKVGYKYEVLNLAIVLLLRKVPSNCHVCARQSPILVVAGLNFLPCGVPILTPVKVIGFVMGL